jgi:hypothetical protein
MSAEAIAESCFDTAVDAGRSLQTKGVDHLPTDGEQVLLAGAHRVMPFHNANRGVEVAALFALGAAISLIYSSFFGLVV